MTPNQKRRQKFRKTGRYAKVNPCYVCGKSAGVEYFSHHDTDGAIGDELLCLCESCYAKLDPIPGPEAVVVAFPKKFPV